METVWCGVSSPSLRRREPFRPTGVGEGYTVTGVSFHPSPERVSDWRVRYAALVSHYDQRQPQVAQDRYHHRRVELPTRCSPHFLCGDQCRLLLAGYFGRSPSDVVSLFLLAISLTDGLTKEWWITTHLFWVRVSAHSQRIEQALPCALFEAIKSRTSEVCCWGLYTQCYVAVRVSDTFGSSANHTFLLEEDDLGISESPITANPCGEGSF